MKRLKFVFLSVAALTVLSLVANDSSANAFFSCGVVDNQELLLVGDGGDADLYLDCFENAVKSKDMELAAKVANVLYDMNLTDFQQKRFAKIEDLISKKDYRAYRDYLKFYASKSSTVQDDYYVDGESNYDEDFSFVDEMIDTFSSFFNDLGVVDSSSWHYERHDTLDGGGFVDVFVDSFGKYLLDDSPEQEMESKRSGDADIDALLDDYEKYVGLSVDSMRRFLSGEESAMKDFDEFSSKASSISEKINRRVNSMSPSQFKRFLHIWEDVVTGWF